MCIVQVTIVYPVVLRYWLMTVAMTMGSSQSNLVALTLIAAFDLVLTFPRGDLQRCFFRGRTLLILLLAWSIDAALLLFRGWGLDGKQTL